MKTPFNTPRSLLHSRLLITTCLSVFATLGCQTSSSLTAKNPPKPPTETAQTKMAGLPKPTNTASSNSALSLDSVDEHLRLGEQALERGNYQEAQIHFDHVLEQHPDHVKAHHRLGVLADKLGQFPQAEQHYLSALSADPRNAALLSDLGYSYFMQGRYADSERYLFEARKFDPEYDKAVANLGLLYASTGRQQEALAMLQQIGDDAQVQSLMQQIAAGQFNATKQLADNSFSNQQSSVVTTQTSVQPAASVPPQEMNDATRGFLDQMQQAREDLRRAEEQYAQQMGQQPMQQGFAANPAGTQNTSPPNASSWPRQAALQQQPQGRPASQYAGVTPFGTQQPANAGQVPNAALAEELAAIDRRSQPNGSTNPIAIGRPEAASPGDQWSQNTPSASMGAMTNAVTQQRVPEYTTSTPQQSPTDSPFAQQSMPVNNGPTNPQSAWAQQFATSADQQATGSGMPPQAPIQYAGANASPQDPQSIEHAHHRQQHGQQPDIALTGQNTPNGPANTSLIPPNLNGNWGGPAQQPGAPSSQPAPQNAQQATAYEQARREAALVGLGAGPGQTFPYVQQTQRVMPGTDSRINGGQYPAPVRHMPSGLTPPNANSQGQFLPQGSATSNPANGAGPSSSSFAQQQQQTRPQSSTAYYQNTPPSARDAYQDARMQQSAQLNGLVNQTWGQSPQSPPYGVTPPSSTQHYGSATSFTPPPNAAQSVPYNQRYDASPSPGTTPVGYESAPMSGGTSNGYSAVPTGGNVVIPEPYRRTQPTGHLGQPTGTPQQATGYPNAGNSSYTAPIIVPGTR